MERPGWAVAALVRSGTIRVPPRYRAWLADELATGRARRRTVFAGALPGCVAVVATVLLLWTLDPEGAAPLWPAALGSFVPLVAASALGLTYRRKADYLRKKNRLAAWEGGMPAGG